MKSTCILLLFLFSNYSFGQKEKSQIEINPIMRYDSYPEFSYNYLGRASTDYLKIEAISWGMSANYKKSCATHLFLKAGIGYYKYAYNKLNNRNSSFGAGNSRGVDYPSTLFILFYTDKYWYNTISGNLGLERWFTLKKDMQINTSINWTHYFTYSKHYHITYDHPDNPINNNYVVPQGRYFGNSVNLTVGITKQINRLLIGPSIIIPVYDLWKKDIKFTENEKESRSKWFGGIGIGITLSKHLNF